MVPLVLAALVMPGQGQETFNCGGSNGESTTHSYEVTHELREDQSSCRAESRPCFSDAFHQILLVVADPGNGRNYRVRMNNCDSEAEDTELCVNTEYGSFATWCLSSPPPPPLLPPRPLSPLRLPRNHSLTPAPGVYQHRGVAARYNDDAGGGEANSGRGNGACLVRPNVDLEADADLLGRAENISVVLEPATHLIQIGTYRGGGQLHLDFACDVTDEAPTELAFNKDLCYDTGEGGRTPDEFTVRPTASPSTTEPTINPSVPPTKNPTAGPTIGPTSLPTMFPTSARPTASPTLLPTTSDPTLSPTLGPTLQPTTSDPTASPGSSQPTLAPSVSPQTTEPSSSPASSAPTTPLPTGSPTINPNVPCDAHEDCVVAVGRPVCVLGEDGVSSRCSPCSECAACADGIDGNCGTECPEGASGDLCGIEAYNDDGCDDGCTDGYYVSDECRAAVPETFIDSEDVTCSQDPPLNCTGGGVTITSFPSGVSSRGVPHGWAETSTGLHPGNFGATYFYADNNAQGTMTWEFAVAVPGEYNVSASYTVKFNRNSAAPFTVNHDGGASAISVDMRATPEECRTVSDDGSTCLSGLTHLGTFPFSAAGSVVLSALGGTGTALSGDSVAVIPASQAVVDGRDDKRCSICIDCEAGTYAATTCAGSTQNVCAAVSDCLADQQYQTAGPTGTSDRQCSALAVCVDGEYEAAPPTPTSDRQCTATGLCGDGDFSATEPTATSDRVCLACNSPEALAFGDRGSGFQPLSETDTAACTAHEVCAPGEFVSVQPSDVVDRECSICAPDTVQEGENEDSCSPRTRCGLGKFQVQAATLSSDAICGDCEQGQYNDEEDTTRAFCREQSVCSVGRVLSTDSTIAFGRCSDCPDNSFQPANDSRALTCDDQPLCVQGERLTSNARVRGGECVACGEEAFQTRDDHRELECDACLQCDTSTEFEATPCVADVDRTCAACQTCPDGAFESGACDGISDRQCSSCTASCEGTDSLTFERIPCTANSNRVCQEVVDCPPESYETVAPTATSNRECQPLTQCDSALQFTSTLATSTTDRACSDLTVCSDGLIEVNPPTATTDRTCGFSGICTARDDEFDLIFLLDGSGSVGPDNFALETAFAAKVIAALQNVSLDSARVAVTVYSEIVDELFNLNMDVATEDATVRESVIAAVQAFPHPLGNQPTATGAAIRYAVRELMTTASGFRGPGIVIVVTDGRSVGGLAEVQSAADELHDIPNVDVISIGIGDRVDQAELTAISSDEAGGVADLTFNFASFAELLSNESVRLVMGAALTCREGYFENQPCTDVHDRTCQACTENCGDGRYITGACRGTHDFTCSLCSGDCPEGEYIGTPCDGVNDRICVPCSGDCADDAYRTDCTATADRICTQCRTECPAGEFMDSPCTATEDLGCFHCGVACDQRLSDEALDELPGIGCGETFTANMSIGEDFMAVRFDTRGASAPHFGMDRVLVSIGTCSSQTIDPNLCVATQYVDDSQFATSNGNGECTSEQRPSDTGLGESAQFVMAPGVHVAQIGTFDGAGSVTLSVACEATVLPISNLQQDANCLRARSLLSQGPGFFESVTCNTDHDRTCNRCSETCPDGSFETTACLQTADQVCTPCSASCPDGEFAVEVCSTVGDRVCGPCDPCADGTFESGPCTPDQNRQCTVCDGACVEGDFEAQACSATTNRLCQTCAASCEEQSDDEAGFALFESVTCTLSSDRECTECRTECPEAQFMVAECSASADRVCAACTVCPIESFISQQCSELSDAQCERCEERCYPGYFEASSCQTGDRSDRDCQLCRDECPPDHIQGSACSAFADLECAPCQPCDADSYETAPCSISSDRECGDCAVCGIGEYEVVPCAGSGAGSSTSESPPGSDGEDGSGSGTDEDAGNRVCATCAPACEEGTFEAASCTPLSDRICTPCSPFCGEEFWESKGCDPFQPAVADISGDRICNPLTVCADDEFEASAPERSTDRVCTPHSQACGPAEFAAGAGGEFADTVCAACQAECELVTQYESAACAFEHDRTCVDCSSCDAGQFVSSHCSSNTDTVCSQCTTADCPAGSYGALACSPNADRRCEACDECGTNEYQVLGCSADQNRLCAATTECTAVEVETAAPTATSDRVCEFTGVCSSSSPFDLVFLIDGSGSVRTANFEHFKTAAINIVQQVHISPDTVRIAAVLFENSAVPQFDFNVCTDNNAAYAALGAIQYPSGNRATSTAAGFQYLADTLFSSDSGFRSDRHTVVVTMTDGAAARGLARLTEAIAAADAVATAGGADITRVSIGVGGFNPEHLAACASSPEDAFPLGGFEDLSQPSLARELGSTYMGCLAGSYEAAVCTREHDRECPACSASCPTESFKVAECTANADIVCAACAPCESSGFEVAPCTATSDRLCDACDQDYFQDGLECHLLSTCDNATEFESLAPTRYTDRICTTIGTCPDLGSGTVFESAAPTLSTDRACEPCTMCEADQFEVRECSPSLDRICATCADCSAGSFQIGSCLETGGNHCATCSPCAQNEYAFESCSQTADTVCMSCSACPDGTVEADPCTTTQDRTCGICSEPCRENEFEATACTAVTDRVCRPCSLGVSPFSTCFGPTRALHSHVAN